MQGMSLNLLTISLQVILFGNYITLAVGTPNYSNLERIKEIKSIQINQLLNPIKDSNDEEIRLYNLCIEVQQEKQQKYDILGPFYLFSVQGIDLTLTFCGYRKLKRLECSPCLPKGYPVSWSKITFENFQSEVMRTDGFSKNSDLILKSPTADLSTYYCSWINANNNKVEMFTNIWTVEIIQASKLHKVPVRLWQDPNPLTNEGITVQMHWHKWSTCNKCDRVGKRHRFGYCLVNANGSSSGTKNKRWEALSVYSFLSCSAFLNFHPEIGALNQEITQHLSTLPKIMIGYCKVPCENYDFDLEERFLIVYPPEIRLIYRNNEEEHPENSEQSLGNINLQEFSRGLKDIPITTDYIPEILAIVSLFGLQLFILFQVCRNRRKAR